MNKNEAIEFEKQLKNYIAREAVNMNLSPDKVNEMIDKYVEIYPDNLIHMGMFDLGENSRSICLGNVRFNLKGFFTAAAGLVASAAIPQDNWGYFVMALNCIIFISGLADTIIKEINENEAYIIAFLHMHDMYNWGLPENEFKSKFKSWYESKTGDDISIQRMQKALNTLYNMNSVEIIEGQIRLKEEVWRNRI